MAIAGVVLSANFASAQVKVDMAQVTCGDILGSYVEDVVVAGAWMSGYFNAKAGNTTIDIKQMDKNANNVVAFCKANPKVTLMDAVKKAATPN